MRAPLTNTAAAASLAALPALTLDPDAHLAATVAFGVALLCVAFSSGMRPARRYGALASAPLAMLAGLTLGVAWVFTLAYWHRFGVGFTASPMQWVMAALIAVAAAGSIALNVTARPGDELDDEPDISPLADHPDLAAASAVPAR